MVFPGSGFTNADAVAARARAIADLRLLNTPPDPAFDEIAQLAADLCGTPICFITLVDGERQFHKSHIGTDLAELPLADGICRHGLESTDLFVVPDMLCDPNLATHPLVTGDTRFRFYAGVPLLFDEHLAVGMLCVVDTVARELTEAQARALRVLGRQLSAQLQLRGRAVAMERQALELRSERELFRNFLDGMPVEACLKDGAGAMLFYNQRVSERFGLQDGEWIGKTAHDLFPPAEAAQLRLEEQHVLQADMPRESYSEHVEEDGTRTFWKLVQTPIRRGPGEMLLGQFSFDLTAELRREATLQQAQDQLEEANRKLRSLALTDNLTGLWNRRAFDGRLLTELQRTRDEGIPLALLMIDVDDFKLLNDTHGHSHGDAVLQQLAAVLRRSIREHDTAARFGGEEFAIILPGSTAEAAGVLCKRLAEELKRTKWERREITVSIGVAQTLPGTTAPELVNMADEAMYSAKRGGKNCTVTYSSAAFPFSASSPLAALKAKSRLQAVPTRARTRRAG